MSERNESAGPYEAGQASRANGRVPVEHHHVALRHTLRVVLAIAVVLYFIAAALILGLRYVVLPRIDTFRPRIETLVSDKIHAELRIGKLSPHWLGFQPGIDVTNLTIRDHNGQTALNVPHATATVSWLSLVTLAPRLSSLIVDRPDVLVARSQGGSLSVAGVPIPSAHTGNDAFSTWLLRQQAIVLRGGTLRWRDGRHNAPEIALQNIRLAILNEGTDHRLALQAPPEGRLLHGPLDFRARFRSPRTGAPGKPVGWSGSAYVSTGPVDLPTLAGYIDIPVETYAGRIDNVIWASFSEGRITTATGVLDGVGVALRVHPTQPRLDMPVAHFSWTIDAAPGDYTVKLSRLRAELGQPPLDDGTPVFRTLSFSTLTGHYRRPSVQHGQMMSVQGDRMDLGMLSEFSRTLPLPRRFLNTLVRFDPRGLVANYEIGIERARPDAGEAAAEQRGDGVEPIVRYRFKADLQGISVAAQEPPPGLTARNHPRAGLPGIENLWGHIDADETHGNATFDTANAAITLPGVFDDPRLTFDRLYGRSDWTIANARAPGEKRKGFQINVPEFGVENADVKASAVANYTNPGHGRGALDLKASFDHAQVNRIVRYLPTSISEKLRIYLGHGLQAGMSRSATIEVHGNLEKFPYSRDPTAGIFRIEAPFTGGRFDPSPYPPRKLKNGTPSVWPGFDRIDGVFRLKENLLRFDIGRGYYKRVLLTGVTGKIDDLGTKASSLVINGNGHGPLADMIDYTNNSALGSLSKHVGEKVEAEGPAALALKLTVPRTPKPHIAVEGALGFQNDRLSMRNVPPLSDLTGKVRFTEHTAELDRLAGRFMGGDVHANGGLRQDGTYALDLDGNIAVDAARGLNLRGTAAQVLTRMSGTAPYALSVRGAKKQLPEVSASSDLTDLALDFPAPFGKPAGQPMPLRLSFRPDNTKEDDAHGDEAGKLEPSGLQRAALTFGPVAATYLLRATPGEPPQVVRGAIGVNRPAELPSEGVTAAVDLDTLDADAWRGVIAAMRGKVQQQPVASAPQASSASAGQTGADQNATAGTAQTAQAAPATGQAPNQTTAKTAAPALPASAVAQFLPSRFAVHIGTLTLLKRHWESVVLGASHTDRTWQANIASNQVSGHLTWLPGAAPGAPGTLEARLAKLVVPARAENDLLGEAISAPAQNMPSIDLVVNELIVRDRNVGRLEVDARNREEDGAPVWQLDKLDISNPAAQLTATANWRTARSFGANADEDAPRRTVLDFKLDIKDAGALLERAGLPRTLKKGSGTLSGKVAWRGGPTAIDYPTLNGNLALELHHGQILKVDPGVAKLLGVLSLQSLARFVTLNFRDVIGEGLPYESVTGTGQIENGIGRTSNFKMVTAPARAEMKGTVDLAHETQNLHVHVVPTLSAGAGVVAAAVINPLFGLGALVADFALSHSISSAFALDYAITGSWSKPHVERVRGEQGKMDAQMPVAAQ
ncbi:AsmA-like C-terminal region-containing protein [Paraburkholderia sp. A1RI_3L]|uniref:YhdP family phospholipid transporter n=1 Tax=Paraburkholderia TaxID=1822464 RepID=UPI003B7797E2